MRETPGPRLPHAAQSDRVCRVEKALLAGMGVGQLRTCRECSVFRQTHPATREPTNRATTLPTWNQHQAYSVYQDCDFLSAYIRPKGLVATAGDVGGACFRSASRASICLSKSSQFERAGSAKLLVPRK